MVEFQELGNIVSIPNIKDEQVTAKWLSEGTHGFLTIDYVSLLGQNETPKNKKYRYKAVLCHHILLGKMI